MSTTSTTAVPSTERSIPGPPRILSVDLLRGLTIALMILVNDPGDGAHVFSQLDHAEWNGWTLTDLVFPTFLFLVGASLIFSLQSRSAKGDSRASLAGHVFLRTIKILFLEFLLVFFPHMHWHSMRLFGVLPRIAICSLIGGLILIALLRVQQKTRVYTLVGLVALLLLGYWILLRFVPVPGFGMPGRDVPFMDQNGNLTAWIDRGFTAWTQRWLHCGTLYVKTRDPEGVLSTLPSLATALLGSLTALWMRTPSGLWRSASMRRMQLWLGGAGALSFALGELWSLSFPINKNMWTSSYVLLAGGLAAMALAALSFFVDRRPEPWPRWFRITTWPWFVFGSNAIVAYATSGVLVKILFAWRPADSDGDRHSLWGIIYETVFARNQSTEWTSLAFAVCFVLACFLPNWLLWQKKWFIKL